MDPANLFHIRQSPTAKRCARLLSICNREDFTYYGSCFWASPYLEMPRYDVLEQIAPYNLANHSDLYLVRRITYMVGFQYCTWDEIS